jgi:hypothetical protein
VRFQPPADGRLSDRHLDLYLRVRRAARGRTERDTARALGLDPAEFTWVEARVIEALVALDARRVRAGAAETYARAVASLRQTRQRARDPATAAALDAQIAAMEREWGTVRRTETLTPALADNVRRVAGRRVEIAALGP